MLRPLIFRNFLSKIFRKIKNVLRPLIENGKIRSKWTLKKNVTPLISRFQRQLPPGGKPFFKAFN